MLVSVQESCTVCAKRTIGSEIILDLMVLLGDEAQGMLVSVCLEIVLILTQDRSTVCAKRAIGLEIVLAAPDCSPR
jgi:hypothetical protein